MVLYKATVCSWFETWCYLTPHSTVPINLHKFHDKKGHQGTIHTFEAIRRSYWWPQLHQNVVKYINKCNICANILPNMVKYPKTSRNSTNPSGSFSYRHHMSFTSHVHGIWMGFNSNLFTHIICVICSNEGKLQAYLSGILAHKGKCSNPQWQWNRILKLSS